MLLVLVRKDVLDTSTELHDIILKRLENHIHRLAILLLESATLLAHNIAGQRTELLTHHALHILLMLLTLTRGTPLGLQLGLHLYASNLLCLTLLSLTTKSLRIGCNGELHLALHLGRSV